MLKISKLLKAIPFFLALTFFSCEEYKNSADIAGKWAFTQKVKQELSTEENDPQAAFANIFVEQTITYSFNGDLTYTKEIKQTVYDYELFDKAYSPVDLESYKGTSQLTMISGTYKASADKILLNAEKISLPTGQELNYKDYFSQNPAIGLQKSKRAYKKDGANLVINSLENGNDESFSPVK